MADRQLTQAPSKKKKPKKEWSYKGKVIFWTVIILVIDEITIGIPEADILLFYIVLARPKWFLEMCHKLYKYVPHRRAWRPVRDVCQRRLVTINPDDLVADAVRKMDEERVRSLIVTQEREYNPALQPSAKQKRSWWGGKRRQKAVEAVSAPTEIIQVPVGVLNDRDVTLQVGAEGLSGETLTVADIMNREVPVAMESEDVHSAVTKMREAGMRRLPVVDQRGALVGILSLDDIIAVLSDGLNDMVELLQREMEREAEAA